MAWYRLGTKPLPEPMLSPDLLTVGPSGIKLQWNLNQNKNISLQENAFENACEMVGIFFRAQSEWVTQAITWTQIDLTTRILWHLPVAPFTNMDR